MPIPSMHAPHAIHVLLLRHGPFKVYRAEIRSKPSHLQPSLKILHTLMLCVWESTMTGAPGIQKTYLNVTTLFACTKWPVNAT